MRSIVRYLLLVLCLLLFPSPVLASQGRIELIVNTNEEKKSVQYLYPDEYGYYLLPTLNNKKGYTFMGWDPRKGQTVSPKYSHGQIIKEDNIKKLYAVYYHSSEEKIIKRYEFATLNTRKYSKIILVGDSKTRGIRRTLILKFGKDFVTDHHIQFVAQSGISFEDFVSERAKVQIKDIVKLAKKVKPKSKPAAIVVNLGVNDLRGEYVDTKILAENASNWLKQISNAVADCNVKLFYMSLTPLSGNPAAQRTQYRVRSYNYRIKKLLPAEYTYIDCYTFLMRTGFSPLNTKDGIHYSSNTNKRVADFIIRYLNAH